MSENKIIKCAKCQNNAETDSRFRNEFAVNYPIRDKDGKIYCWDCYKSFSSCKGCGKSVANIKFPRSGQPMYPHCSGGVSYGCERISNNVEFICSKVCSKKLADQKYQAWKDKLNQGWTKCKDCVKFWIDGESNEEGWEWLKEERQHSRFIKLLSPGQEKEICDRCKPYAKDGYYHKIHQQAQKYWDLLSKEEKLKAVIRTGGVRMAKFYGETKTAEQLAEQEKAPRSIYEDFVHNQKCGTCGEEPCRDEKRSRNNNSSCSLSSATDEATPKINNQEGRGNNQPSQESLQNQKKLNAQGGSNYSGLIIGGIVVAFLTPLAAILAVKRKKKKN